MFPSCIDRLGRQKKEKENDKKQTKKNKGKNEQIKNRNNSTYHEPLSKEFIGRRSGFLHQIRF